MYEMKSAGFVVVEAMVKARDEILDALATLESVCCHPVVAQPGHSVMKLSRQTLDTPLGPLLVAACDEREPSGAEECSATQPEKKECFDLRWEEQVHHQKKRSLHNSSSTHKAILHWIHDPATTERLDDMGRCQCFTVPIRLMRT